MPSCELANRSKMSHWSITRKAWRHVQSAAENALALTSSKIGPQSHSRYRIKAAALDELHLFQTQAARHRRLEKRMNGVGGYGHWPDENDGASPSDTPPPTRSRLSLCFGCACLLDA